MGIAALVVFYSSAVFLVAASFFAFKKYLAAPVHLHWELYRGSSAYELSDWWTKKPRSLGNKLWTAGLDVLFLRDYYRRNRSFWYFLETFHLGIYSLILWHVWLFGRAAAGPVVAEPVGSLVWGHSAFALALVGSVGILVKRITDADMRAFYPPIHFVKWVFLILALGGGFYAVQFHFAGSMSGALAYVREQLAFNLAAKLHAPAATSAHLLLAAPWLVYFPFSHIMKLGFRYYHFFRWDDVPNVRGGLIEKKIGQALGKRVSWAAPHIQSGRTWAEVATQIPGETPGSETK